MLASPEPILGLLRRRASPDFMDFGLGGAIGFDNFNFGEACRHGPAFGIVNHPPRHALEKGPGRAMMFKNLGLGIFGDPCGTPFAPIFARNRPSLSRMIVGVLLSTCSVLFRQHDR